MIKLFIHTIFIRRENILFLEEWLEYHILLGVDHFYLYDNSKSIGRNGSTPTTNKYKYNFFNITSFLSDKDIEEKFSKIISKFKNFVTLVDWQPRNKENKICYGQKESILHYLNCISLIDTWTAFIDIDEFIFSKIPLKNLISILDFNCYSDIILYQKKFDERFNNLDKPVTSITKCIEGVDTTKWAPKHILKNENVDISRHIEQWDIHYMPVIQGYETYCDETFKNLRFNHYNTNPIQLQWMKNFFKTEDDFRFNGDCSELLNLYENLKIQNNKNEE